MLAAKQCIHACVGSVRNVLGSVSTGSSNYCFITSRVHVCVERCVQRVRVRGSRHAVTVHVFADKSTRVSLLKRYAVSISMLLYGMLMGCVRTATLGVATVLNPITGTRGFASGVLISTVRAYVCRLSLHWFMRASFAVLLCSELDADVDHSSALHLIRTACVAALAFFG